MYYLLLIGAVPIWHNPDMLVALVVQYHSFTYILDCVWYMPVMLCMSTSAAPSQPETAAVWVQQLVHNTLPQCLSGYTVHSTHFYYLFTP
jgi:hypothetical protein